jgi:hypothetical protein
MHRSFGLMLLAMTSVVVPAFAQTENRPTGTWRGSVERNGEQSPMILRLMQKEGLWKGRADVGGSASPLTKVQVDGEHVRFTIKGQGTFDGTYSKDTLTGSVAGSKKGRSPASFTLTRQEESREDMQVAIDSIIESSGP